MQRHLLNKTWHAVLPGRGVLALDGRDTRKLLQGLVTSDVASLEEQPQHTAFLAHNGRILFDAFLVPGPADGVLIEAEAAVIPALAAHLRRYKLRSKVTFTDRTDEFAVVAICGHDAASAAAAMAPETGAAWVDARLEALGYRQLVPRGSLAAAASALPPAAPAELHSLLSVLLGVPDGAQDMPAGECVPHESNLELLGSINFSKGCYLGQELTARTEFRGTVRKRLVPVVRAGGAAGGATGGGGGGGGGSAAEAECVPALSHLPAAERRLAAELFPSGVEELPPSGDMAGAAGASLKTGAGKAVGKLRSFSAAWGCGLALCRLEALQADGPLVDERGDEGSGPLLPHRPSWWPERVK